VRDAARSSEGEVEPPSLRSQSRSTKRTKACSLIARCASSSSGFKAGQSRGDRDSLCISALLMSGSFDDRVLPLARRPPLRR
jgi:hypothetical protein